MQDQSGNAQNNSNPIDLTGLEGNRMQQAAAGCPEGYISYVINRGQTLYAIAQQFNTTVADILAANPNLDAQLYYEGDTICVPQNTSGVCPNGTPYTVRRGDSFYLIARRYGIPLADLLAANPNVEPQRLMVGQVICIPGTGGGGITPSGCPAGYGAHTVTQGQTFADILILYNVSYNALAQANKSVDLNNLPLGQQLCIAPSGTRGTCANGNSPYTIQRGDTLTGIAATYNTSVGAILRANPVLAPTDFITGRIICLP